MGPDLARRALGIAPQGDDDLPADIKAVIVARADFRRVETVADEHRIGVDGLIGKSTVWIKADVDSVGECLPANGDPRRRARLPLGFCERNLLIPAAVIARLQAKRGEPCGDIARGRVVAGGAGIAPLELVVGQEGDVGLDPVAGKLRLRTAVGLLTARG